MMIRWTLAALAAAMLAGPAAAAPDPQKADPQKADPQEAAAIAATQSLFDAMAAHDPDAVRQAVLPGTVFTSIRPGAGGATSVNRLTVEDFAKALRPGYHEQMWSPRVSLRGDLLATVAGPYEFQLDGKTTHCGIDVFDLAKVEGRWRIAALTWTAEPEACPELKARK